MATSTATTTQFFGRPQDYYRPEHLRGVPCTWRLHSVVSPCLCERRLPAMAPIDVLNVRKLPGPNTPWLGSPSFTNLNYPPYFSPTSPTAKEALRQRRQQRDRAPKPPPKDADSKKPEAHPHPLSSHPPFPPTPATPHEPVWGPAKKATLMLATHTRDDAPHSQNWDCDSIISAPSTLDESTWDGGEARPGANTISPLSPLSFRGVDWPDFCRHQPGPSSCRRCGGGMGVGVDEDDGELTPTAVEASLGCAGLFISQGGDLPRPRTTDGRPSEEARRNPTLYFYAGNGCRDATDHGTGTGARSARPPPPPQPPPQPERASTAPTPTLSPSGSSSPVRRKPVPNPSAPGLRMIVTQPSIDTMRDGSPTFDPSTATIDSLLWRHTVACPEEAALDGGVPQLQMFESVNVRAAEKAAPTPPPPMSRELTMKPLPRLPKDEAAPRYGGSAGRRPSKASLSVDEPMRRRTIEPSGIGIEPTQWLDLQLAVMGVAGPWNAFTISP